VSRANPLGEKNVPNLSKLELLAWRGLLETHARLLLALGDDLRRFASLSLSEFDVLLQLWLHRGDRMRMKSLAAALLVTPSGATRTVARLEREGLVTRASRQGEQAVYASLTDAGRVKLKAAMDIHFAGVRQLFTATLSDTEMRMLVALWHKFDIRFKQR
jgi:DNA-binding MarR family transcriptional regulator